MRFFTTKHQRDYWATLLLGALMIGLLIFLAVSFFIAIRDSQIYSREQFLSSQTELVARQLQKEVQRFEFDAKEVRKFIDGDTMPPESYGRELTETVRRVFVTYPHLIDSVWVSFPDSVVSFEMTRRNDFLRRPVPKTELAYSEKIYRLDGDSGLDLVFFLDLPAFAEYFVTGFYLDPEGAKYLIMDEKLVLLSKPGQTGVPSIGLEALARVRSDVESRLKGIYKLNWTSGDADGPGIAAQYPFDFGQIKQNVALVFLLKTDDLNSGIYSTYFYLFLFLVLILAGTVLIFSFSILNNEKAKTELERKGQEISDLFDQQSLLLQELKGFVFFHNYQGKITRVTQEMERILGRNLQQFLNAFKKDSRQEDAKRIRKYILSAVQNKVPYLDFEYDYVRSDGKKIRLRIFEKLVYDEQGRFVGGNGICTDITPQYQSRNELIQSENKLRNVIGNIPDVISIYSNHGKLLSIDIKDRSNLVPEFAEQVGSHIKKDSTNSQDLKIWEAFERSRKTGRIQTVEWKSVQNKVIRYFEIRFFPLDNTQMMSLSKEITAQKVWEKGLIEAMNAADKANQAKSEFLANMSHEIRTPLNGLLGIIDLLERTELTEKQLRFLNIIRSSGHSLLSIIKDILDYSKIEAGRIELRDEVFNPAVELEKVANIFLGLSQKKGIKLTLKIDEEVRGWYDGDKDKWNQVLLNLIGNAIKFTPENGRVLVKLSTEALTDFAYFIHCEVHDSGIGIPEEKIPFLTDPFYQVESASDRSYQGTGLGLAIAKKIIQIMGGDLHISSKGGEGSVFAFHVLLNKSEAQEGELESTSYEPILNESLLGKKFPLRILLAEDNELNLELMSLMLSQIQYDFDVARNGLEVLTALKEKTYDVILMDVQMPLMNGLEAARRIREGDVQSDVLIIGLSANVFDEDFKKALEMGMDDYLTKPIRLSILAAKLEQSYHRLFTADTTKKRT